MKRVFIYKYDPLEGTGFTGYLNRPKDENAVRAKRLRGAIDGGGKLESRRRRVPDGYRANPYTGVIPASKIESQTALTFPQGTPLADIVARVYPHALGEGTELIKANNALRTYEGPLGRGLSAPQWIDCPDYVSPAEEVAPSPDAPQEEKDFFDWKGALGDIAGEAFSNIKVLPDYINKQLVTLNKCPEEEIAIVIFYAKTALTDPGGQGNHVRVSDEISISCRDSLFEGARVFKFKMPFDENFVAGAGHRYGNHIAVMIKGVPVFMGLMINPKIGRGKGRTIEWTCMSHSYRLIKSHFNPMSFQTEWRDMTPLDAVRKISTAHEHPVFIGKNERRALSVAYEDEEGLRNLGDDIRTSTPFKFMSKLVNAAGRFLHAAADGFLVVQSIDTGRTPKTLITEGQETASDISTVFGEFTVEYNFDELAGNYMVMDQKRQADGAQMVQIQPWPIGGLFKNIARLESAPIVLDGVSKYVGLGDEKGYSTPKTEEFKKVVADARARDAEAREVKRSLGATVFEISKAMANAVKINIDVPGWLDPSGAPWQTSTPVYVRSETYSLPVTPAIVTSVDFRATNKVKMTKLQATLTGRFDAVLPSSIPFLLDPRQELEYVPVDYESLLEDSKANQSVESKGGQSEA